MQSLKISWIGFFGLIMLGSLFLVQCSNPAKEEKSQVPASKEKPLERERPKLVHDARGNITERHAISYRSDNSIRARESYYYKYDDRNNLIEETKESSTPQGELVYKNINYYTYNSLNQKVEQKFFSYNKDNQIQQQARNTFRYNAKGDVIEEKSYFENGSVKSVVNTGRNELGELKSEEYIYFNKEGEKTGHKKYHYTQYGLERTEDLMKK
jgi:hypothetical protein